MDQRMEGATVNELAELRCLIKEFLNGGEGTRQVRQYISSVAQDDSLLLIYLKGRKYRVKHAWETLKRNAEVRFNEYPEVFPESVPEEFFPLLRNNIAGFLKARDKFGHRVLYFHGGKWEPSEISLEKLTAVCTHYVEKILLDEDAMNNGIILVQDCAGMGMKHFREYSLHGMLRAVNIFCYAFPIKFKGSCFLNVPYYTRYLFKLIKPFLPKKLQDRIIFSTSDQKFEILHERLTPKLLPKFLGGVQENNEAIDYEFFQYVK